jgi:Domain of unknown function (DUF5658)
VSPLLKGLLLFLMNWLDAQLTILWVRLNVATEGNGVMALLLNKGETPFLVTKLAVGAFAAYMLYRCSNFTIARRGMHVVLGIYGTLMVVHALTGFFALGWEAPVTVIAYFAQLPKAVFTVFSS